MSEYKEGEWNREGELLYTVKHVGWEKGEQQFSNRLMVRVDVTGGVTQEEHQALIESIHEFLKGLPSNNTDKGNG